MTTPQLVGGPHDGLRWHGARDPVIFLEDDNGRTSIYHYSDADGHYHWHHDRTPPLFDDHPDPDHDHN